MTALELLQSGQPFKAMPFLKKKVAKDPSVENLLAYASCQRACAYFDGCEETLMRLMKIAPSAEVMNNIAQLQSDRGKFHEVPTIFQRALAMAQQPGFPNESMQQILLGMAYSLMRLGQFQHTWEAFEAGRLGVSWGPLPTTKVWQGEQNARVLIVCEGGFGDGFLFSRWIPKVREISDRVGIVVWNKLIDFCDWKKFGVHQVFPMLGSIEAANWDYTTSIMSLPGIFKMSSWANIPPDGMLEAYLETVPSDQRLIAVRTPPKRIGFCWRAEENGSVRKIRSLDDVTAGQVAKFLSKTAEVYSLCPALKSLHRHDQFKPLKGIVQDENAMRGWRNTADYIRTMDFVVTVDTAVFHLAGLLNVPTLLLLPVRSDWKYRVHPSGKYETGMEPDYDPWYGSHVMYYRETRPEGWTPAAIKDAIALKLRTMQTTET